MRQAFPTSKTCPNGSPISSLESADGLWLSDLQDGPRTRKSGPGVAPASLSVQPGKEKEPPTSDICGLNFSDSSPSAALQRSLESKLRQRLDVNGSLEYVLTWKHWDMPSGPRIYALRASARRTSDKDFIGPLKGFPTPCVQDGPHGGKAQGTDRLPAAAALTGWGRTPQTSDGDGGVKEIRPGTTGRYKLRDFAQLAGWVTSAATTWGGSPEAHLERKRKAIAAGKSMGLVVSCPDQQALLAGWATATATKLTQSGELQNKDGTPWDGQSKPYQNGKQVTTAIGDQVKMAGWPTTTTTRDSKWNGKDGDSRTGSPSLPGLITELFLVPTGRRVVLAPEFSLWLMGFPEEWVTAAPGYGSWAEAQAALELEYSKDQGTPSSPSSPPSSSGPI